MKRTHINQNSRFKVKREAGFSVIEAIIAMLVLLIGLLGVFSVLTYAIVYNSGNNDRSQAMSVLQQQVELYRSFRFSPDTMETDPNIYGGVKSPQTATSEDGSVFTVDVTVDNYPFDDGSLTDNEADTKYKEIKITIEQNTQYSWAKTLPVTVVFRRTISN